MWSFIKRQSPGRIIVCGFLLVIFIGSLLLMMPFSIKEGATVRYIDALYTSTSAVCVTGLIAIPAGDHFTPIGQFILILLIQIGGLGVTSVGAGIILAMGKKMHLKGRNLLQEAMNLNSGRGVVNLVKNVFFTTMVIELIGAILSFIVFIKDYEFWNAVGISIFHSVAAFNNSGFDILINGGNNLIPYQDNILLNLVTCGLIILGGIGFLVIEEIRTKKFHWKKYSMHTKVVLSVSFVLLVIGTLLIKATEDITWLGAFFASVSARTAGFSTFPLKDFTNAGLLVMMILMFIGASPGSTGGGIKTTTFFTLIRGIMSSATNRQEKAFKYSFPKYAFRKSAVITLIALITVLVSTYLLLVFDPYLELRDALFEMASAFGTVGLSTGITPTLSVSSKIVSIIMMFIGRLGPLTIASLWVFSRGENIKYPEGNITIG